MSTKTKEILPDITRESSPIIQRTIDNVGMTNITCPILIEDNSHIKEIPAKLNLFINIADPKIKGIHMSRLYTTTINHFETTVFNHDSVKECLKKCLHTHKESSDSAALEISYDQLIKQPALKSELTGYRSYPIKLSASLKDNKIIYSLEFTITYSSTCPCSAALSRHAIQEKFNMDHHDQDSVSKTAVLDWLAKESNIVATPHAQRSYAKINISYLDSQTITILNFINEAESTIQTSVQAAVKREDEKLFAINNAKHLMFCEDAIRKLDHWLSLKDDLIDYNITVNHHESLHPHNATAFTKKH